MPNDRFLSRWSKRKAQGRSRPGANSATSAPAAMADEAPDVMETIEPTAEESDTGLATKQAASNDDIAATLSPEEIEEKSQELGLPPLSTLGAGSDFKPFMAVDVPQQLRNLALRKLWSSNPVLANVDGLVDYGEDFTDAARVVKDMQTAYQVGRGYARAEEPAPEDEDPATSDQIATTDAPESPTESVPQDQVKDTADTAENQRGDVVEGTDSDDTDQPATELARDGHPAEASKA